MAETTKFRRQDCRSYVLQERRDNSQDLQTQLAGLSRSQEQKPNSVKDRDVRRQAEFRLGTDSACRMWLKSQPTSGPTHGSKSTASTVLKEANMRFFDQGYDKAVTIEALKPVKHETSDASNSVQHYMAEVDGVLIGVVVSYGTRGVKFYRVNPDTGALTLIPAEFDE